MEEQQRLMAIIAGAVSAYLQMEQSLPAAAKTPRAKPRSTMSRWKILGRRKLSIADRMIRNRLLR